MQVNRLVRLKDRGIKKKEPTDSRTAKKEMDGK